jgi:hypothetical protein
VKIEPGNGTVQHDDTGEDSECRIDSEPERLSRQQQRQRPHDEQVSREDEVIFADRIQAIADSALKGIDQQVDGRAQCEESLHQMSCPAIMELQANGIPISTAELRL